MMSINSVNRQLHKTTVIHQHHSLSAIVRQQKHRRVLIHLLKRNSSTFAFFLTNEGNIRPLSAEIFKHAPRLQL